MEIAIFSSNLPNNDNFPVPIGGRSRAVVYVRAEVITSDKNNPLLTDGLEHEGENFVNTVFVETCEYCDTPLNAPNFAYHYCPGRKKLTYTTGK